MYTQTDFCQKCEDRLKNPMYRPKVISVDGLSEGETDLMLELITHFRELKNPNRNTMISAQVNLQEDE